MKININCFCTNGQGYLGFCHGDYDLFSPDDKEPVSMKEDEFCLDDAWRITMPALYPCGKFAKFETPGSAFASKCR